MSKVGIIGDKDTVMGFLALGIDIFPAYSADEIKKTINRLAEREYAIIYITEEASLQAKETIAKYKTLTPEPVAAYILAKETEAKCVRIIMTCKLQDIDPETIKERVREAYG